MSKDTSIVDAAISVIQAGVAEGCSLATMFQSVDAALRNSAKRGTVAVHDLSRLLDAISGSVAVHMITASAVPTVHEIQLEQLVQKLLAITYISGPARQNVVPVLQSRNVTPAITSACADFVPGGLKLLTESASNAYWSISTKDDSPTYVQPSGAARKYLRTVTLHELNSAEEKLAKLCTSVASTLSTYSGPLSDEVMRGRALEMLKLGIRSHEILLEMSATAFNPLLGGQASSAVRNILNASNAASADKEIALVAKEQMLQADTEVYAYSIFSGYMENTHVARSWVNSTIVLTAEYYLLLDVTKHCLAMALENVLHQIDPTETTLIELPIVRDRQYGDQWLRASITGYRAVSGDDRVAQVYVDTSSTHCIAVHDPSVVQQFILNALLVKLATLRGVTSVKATVLVDKKLSAFGGEIPKYAPPEEDEVVSLKTVFPFSNGVYNGNIGMLEATTAISNRMRKVPLARRVPHDYRPPSQILCEMQDPANANAVVRFTNWLNQNWAIFGATPLGGVMFDEFFRDVIVGTSNQLHQIAGFSASGKTTLMQHLHGLLGNGHEAVATTLKADLFGGSKFDMQSLAMPFGEQVRFISIDDAMALDYASTGKTILGSLMVRTEVNSKNTKDKAVVLSTTFVVSTNKFSKYGTISRLDEANTEAIARRVVPHMLGYTTIAARGARQAMLAEQYPEAVKGTIYERAIGDQMPSGLVADWLLSVFVSRHVGRSKLYEGDRSGNDDHAGIRGYQDRVRRRGANGRLCQKCTAELPVVDFDDYKDHVGATKRVSATVSWTPYVCSTCRYTWDDLPSELPQNERAALLEIQRLFMPMTKQGSEYHAYMAPQIPTSNPLRGGSHSMLDANSQPIFEYVYDRIESAYRLGCAYNVYTYEQALRYLGILARETGSLSLARGDGYSNEPLVGMRSILLELWARQAPAFSDTEHGAYYIDPHFSNIVLPVLDVSVAGVPKQATTELMASGTMQLS